MLVFDRNLVVVDGAGEGSRTLDIQLGKRGVSIEAAMALTGHKSLQTVLAHYREVPQAELRAAVGVMDESPVSTTPTRASGRESAQ